MRSKAIILSFLTLALLGCNTVYTIPIDDVYHWPDAYTSSSSASKTSSASSANSTSTTSSTPSVEYVNVQDTTVTIRIKK